MSIVYTVYFQKRNNFVMTIERAVRCVRKPDEEYDDKDINTRSPCNMCSPEI